MDLFQAENLNETADVEFDRLCDLCTAIFDGSHNWKRSCGYSVGDLDGNHDRDSAGEKPHGDIHSLIESSKSGCHLCSLLLGQITAQNVEKLQRDLAEGIVPPNKQLVTLMRDSRDAENIHSEEFRLGLSAVVGHFFEPGPLGSSDSGIATCAELEIWEARRDTSNQERFLGVWSCSSHTIDQISSWTRTCIDEHDECRNMEALTATRKILPTRLLDLSTLAEDRCIRLVKSEGLSLDTKYITLSHCWGGYSDKMLTAATLSEFETGLLVDSLPATFRHAVIITQTQGVLYLWIDTLCIIQDFENGQEWLKEASLMGDIYANSHLTIAATVSPDSRGGLFWRRSPLSVWPCRVILDWKWRGPYPAVVFARDWAREADMKPLVERAWALQEWLLSKRLVHFSGDQVRWECHKGSVSEVFPSKGREIYYPNPLYDILIKKDTFRFMKKWGITYNQDTWDGIKASYTRKHLTRNTDRVAAFAGIARAAYKAMEVPEDDYIAGLSKSHLIKDIMWYSPTAQRERESHEDSAIRGPSWSWVSLDSPITPGTYPWAPPGVRYIPSHYQVLAEFLNVKAELAVDPFGPTRNALLTISCALCEVEVGSSLRDGAHMSAISQSSVAVTINGTLFAKECKVFFDRTPTRTLSRKFTKIFSHPARTISGCFAAIFSGPTRCRTAKLDIEGLLLQRCGESAGRYARIGVLRFEELNENEHARVMSELVSHGVSSEDLYCEKLEDGKVAIEII